MEKVDWETYKKAWYESDEKTHALMMSSKIFDSSEELIKKYRIENVEPKDILLPISYYFLKLNGLEKTVAELEIVGIKDGLRFLVDLKDSLDMGSLIKEGSTLDSISIDKEKQGIPVAINTSPSLVPSPTTSMSRSVQPILTPPTPIQREPQAAPHIIHTMANDITAIRAQQETPVHSSSQADILPSPTPPPHPTTNSPRWESDAQ